MSPAPGGLVLIGSALLVALASSTTLAAGAFGVWERRASRLGQAELVRQASGLRSQRDAADKRAKEAVAECERLRAMSLASRRLGGESVFSGRLSPRDAEDLARLARGLTFVDDVVVADASGLPLSRETDAESPDLARLAPGTLDLVEAFRRVGLAAAEVSFETFTATRIAARPLGGRGAGSVAIVRTTSQPVNPLVLDALAYASAVDGQAVAARRSPLSPATMRTTEWNDLGSTLTTEALAPLERALGAEHRAYLLVESGRVVLTAANLGPDEGTRSAVAQTLGAVAGRAASGLRVARLARVEVTLEDGRTVAWSSFGLRARHALVTFTDAGLTSASKLDRLVGSLRRAVEMAQPTPLEGAA